MSSDAASPTASRSSAAQVSAEASTPAVVAGARSAPQPSMVSSVSQSVGEPRELLRVIWFRDGVTDMGAVDAGRPLPAGSELTEAEKKVAEALARRVEKTLGRSANASFDLSEEERSFVERAVNPKTSYADAALPSGWHRYRNVVVIRTEGFREPSGVSWKTLDVPIFVRPPIVEPAYVRTAPPGSAIRLHINRIQDLYAVADWIVEFVRMNQTDAGAL